MGAMGKSNLVLVVTLLSSMNAAMAWPKGPLTNHELRNAVKDYFAGRWYAYKWGNIKYWNTRKVTSMSALFKGKRHFNAPIQDWDTSKVRTMKEMFMNAAAFNRPIGNWHTGKVKNMVRMFRGASTFNRPLRNWDTSSCTKMQGMFRDAVAFNRAIGRWNTYKVTNMEKMFACASAFNRDISKWRVPRHTNCNCIVSGAKSFYYRKPRRCVDNKYSCPRCRNGGGGGGCYPFWAQVRIVRGSRYAHRSKVCGRVTSVWGICGAGWGKVKFEDGHVSWFQSKDLKPCRRRHDAEVTTAAPP